MTRRLVVALLLFTAVILLLSVVPLGISISARDHSDYANATRSIATSVATLAEDAFDDPRHSVSPSRLAAAAGTGTSVLVQDLHGVTLAQVGPRRVFPSSLIVAARAGRVVSDSSRDDVLAAAPVVADATIRGVVVVGRPDEPVESRVTRLWVVLGAIALLALLLAVALSVGTAGWVGRPLRQLGVTAQRWSEGSLHERAASSGPPEVREVATALNVMAARLDTLVHGSRAVVADVSHQLRTPLAAIRLRLELVRDEMTRAGGASAMQEDLAMCLAEVERLSRMVDGLLTVARAESSATASEPVDVAAVVRERRQAWQPVAEERGVTLDVSGADVPVVAAATPGHLEQILDNLLDNALEVLGSGGHVDVSIERGTDEITVAVRDDGPGMTHEQQEAAFRRFFSGRPGTGTGLGLAVVHRLVTADGGAVTLRSAAGAGTSVTIQLPAARRADVREDERPHR